MPSCPPKWLPDVICVMPEQGFREFGTSAHVSQCSQIVYLQNASVGAKSKLGGESVASVHYRYAFDCDPIRSRLENYIDLEE